MKRILRAFLLSLLGIVLTVAAPDSLHWQKCFESTMQPIQLITNIDEVAPFVNCTVAFEVMDHEGTRYGYCDVLDSWNPSEAGYRGMKARQLCDFRNTTRPLVPVLLLTDAIIKAYSSLRMRKAASGELMTRKSSHRR